MAGENGSAVRALGGPLYAEHLKLGATFGEGRVALSYAGEEGETNDPSSQTILSDVSDLRVLLMDGPAAPVFAHAAFAGAELMPGGCAHEAVLTGDGALASVPLLARTGEEEYLALDLSARSEVLDGWLSFLAGIERDGVRPFAGLSTSDATGSHAVLVLWGDLARTVIGDYVGAQRLPEPGEVAGLDLDRIPCIVAHVPGLAAPCYLVFVPPVHAVALWRSLLSFTEVQPVGRVGLTARLVRELPWVGLLASGDVLLPGAAELTSWGVVRPSADFVGARGLGA